MKNLAVSIIQSDLIWENKKANLGNFTSKINQISEETDLIVLPEMFTTGFSMNPQQLAEKMDGTTIQWMQNIANEKNSSIMGSLIIEENDQYFNRLIWIDSEGEIAQYNKRHLFAMAKEDQFYKAGSERVIINHKGWRILPLICYDLRFPVWVRNQNDYDLIVYMANWPKARINAWDHLLKARAIENQAYAIGVNRVGTDANNYEYPGHSVIIDPLGIELASFEDNQEATSTKSLNAESLLKFRQKFPFSAEADQFRFKTTE